MRWTHPLAVSAIALLAPLAAPSVAAAAGGETEVVFGSATQPGETGGAATEVQVKGHLKTASECRRGRKVLLTVTDESGKPLSGVTATAKSKGKKGKWTLKGDLLSALTSDQRLQVRTTGAEKRGTNCEAAGVLLEQVVNSTQT